MFTPVQLNSIKIGLNINYVNVLFCIQNQLRGISCDEENDKYFKFLFVLGLYFIGYVRHAGRNLCHQYDGWADFNIFPIRGSFIRCGWFVFHFSGR